MKSMMVAVMAVIVGLSTGCAQIAYLQDPANYRVNELTGQRMYCHGDSRDNYTPCEGYQSPAQIAQAAEQEKIVARSEAIVAKKKALIEAEINRERARNGIFLLQEGYPAIYSQDEVKLLEWAEPLTIAQLQQFLTDKEAKRLAAAKRQAIADKKQAIIDAKEEKAFTAARNRKIAAEEKRYADEAKKEQARQNALTPAQRKAEQVKTKCTFQMMQSHVPLSYMSDWMRQCKIEAKMLDQVERLQQAAE